MKHLLKDFNAYRFYEKHEGPLSSIRQFTAEEVTNVGYKVGILNIDEIYNNRVRLEALLHKLFIEKDGKPQQIYPYYAAVYKKLPEENKLHIRFTNPEMLCIPMSGFSKEHVSFTFGRSVRAFTRRDNHPTRRKLYMWDEAEEIINRFPFNEDDELWLEMQIWDTSTIQQYYNGSMGSYVHDVVIEGRLSSVEKELLKKKYEGFLGIIKSEYFFEPNSIHGTAHAIRVLILSQELADIYQFENHHKEILRYCSAFHDIGRDTHGKDDEHGYKSYKKLIGLNLIPESFDQESKETVQFIIENHQLDHDVAKKNIENYSIKDKEIAFKVYCILKDADTLDRCRFGHVVQSYLSFVPSRKLIYLAYQLLSIYR